MSVTFLRVLAGTKTAVAVALGLAVMSATTAQAAPRPARQIHDIQGRGHISPFLGKKVTRIPGVVTATAENGFWMQGTSPDEDPGTSEGIFVFTRTRPRVTVGDEVQVSGTVNEFRPGGPKSANLSRTEIDSSSITVRRHGAPLPAPTVLGPGGRRPPGEVIDDDVRGDVEKSGKYQPGRDGLDFYESLEGMLVAVDDAVAVGPRSEFGEIPVLPAGGQGAGMRSARGGIVARAKDANPERIILDDALQPLPPMNVADRLPGRTLGVLDYSYGDYKLLVLSVPAVRGGGLTRTRTRPQRPDELAVATVALDGLDPGDPPQRFAAIADQIVTALAAPDLVTVTGLQDNSGSDDDGTVAADQTVAQLLAAISAAGGPGYDWRSIDPLDGADGGESGGNIRTGFLFRTDRGLRFVDRPGGTATAPVEAIPDGAREAALSISPGRVAPQHPAWRQARKPLAGEFRWRGRRLIAIANHWTARGADDSLYARFQPPRRPSEASHAEQAKVLAGFVRKLRRAGPGTGVIVTGGLNSYGHSRALRTLTDRTGLRDLVAELPRKERYTVISAGNGHDPDHILVNRALAELPHEIEAVRLNAEFADRVSEHDPLVLRLRTG